MTTTMIAGISWIINIDQLVAIAAAAAAAADDDDDDDDDDNDNDNSKGNGNDNNGDDNDRMEGEQATVSKQIFFHSSPLQLYLAYDDISLSLLAVIL